jgi:hypothetical protein
MNGKKAKALRRLARTLKLPAENKYQPTGVLRRVEDRVGPDGKLYKGGLVRRPFALAVCERRAYQEAKAMYKGATVDAGPAPVGPVILHPTERSFADRAVDSMRRQNATE